MREALALGLAPLLAALCALFVRDLRSLRAVCAVAGVAHVCATVWVAAPVFFRREASAFLLFFRLDGIAAWMASVNAIVFGAAMVGAALLLDRPEDLHVTQRGARALFGLASLFIITANAVVCASNLGAMWVAMEATTLVTAPIILLQGTRRSIEAAWKYLILCGVGIAFALLGTVFLLASGGDGGSLELDWLMANVGSLRPTLLDASFVFFLLGYGTKAGLFPVHNWLPDAHSEAPAPASALLSGALLNCAMVALWRIGGIVENSDSRGLLIGLVAPLGALSVFAAGMMLVRQSDLKRMWAYSSIENMGLLAVAVGLRAAPIFALHALAHSLAKSSAFLLAGNVVRSYGTVSLAKLGGVMRRTPGLGFALLAAGAAVMGAPPFASFVSEWLLVAHAADRGHWAIVAAIAAGLAVSFVAVLIHLGKVVFGEKAEKQDTRQASGSIAPAVVLLALSVAVFVLVTPLVIETVGGALSSGGQAWSASTR